MKKILFVVAVSLAYVAGMAQINRANLDPSVKPGDNFWQYAVGGWLEANPLDKQHPENGAFTDLEELNKDRINELIMEYAGQQLPQGTDGQKIGSLYRLYMDSVARNNLGFEPIKPYLEQVRQLQTRDDLLKLMYEFDSKGFNTAPFGISLNLNPFNSSEFMMSVGHGGASLPQEYYADPNEQQAAVVAAIKSLNKDLLKMVGYTDEVAEQMMEAEWAIEHKIGVKTLDQVASRNPMATIHFMPWTQLLDEFKGIDWESYRAAINYPKDIDTVNVAQLDPLHEVEDVLANTSLDDLKAYMEIHVIKAYAGFLSDDFTDRMFEA
ncbi:MAG: M13 family peptidase, partial [Bacteroidaceae bacterium]|nr:M13 family peptidase [Bacteroidaceae bacterium]